MGVELPFALPPVSAPAQQSAAQQILVTGTRPLDSGASP